MKRRPGTAVPESMLTRRAFLRLAGAVALAGVALPIPARATGAAFRATVTVKLDDAILPTRRENRG